MLREERNDCVCKGILDYKQLSVLGFLVFYFNKGVVTVKKCRILVSLVKML